MKHRSDYRIMKTRKNGYYTYYHVQKRFLLFFWEDCSRAFDHIHQAERWISDDLVIETREVVE